MVIIYNITPTSTTNRYKGLIVILFYNFQRRCTKSHKHIHLLTPSMSSIIIYELCDYKRSNLNPGVIIQMLSSVVFINIKGQILIYRAFKDDITRAEIQHYCSQVVATKEYRDNPILLLNGVSYITVPYKDLIFLATTKTNVNAAMAIQFLYQLIFICKAYCNGEITENDVKKKFSLIYQILDQVMDYGCPQFTDPTLLKNYIQEGGFNDELLKDLKKLKQLTSQATGVTSWRPEGIVHKKNEIYIDVIENVNALFSAKGTILRADVSGVIKLNSKLSGMPECKLGMNDKLLMEKEPRKAGVTTSDKGITIDDMKFHQCVKLPKFDKERSITFIPPDGSFELMSYRITQNINLPFKIMPVYTEVAGNKLEIRVKLKAIYDKNLNANNVVVKIPSPKSTASVTSNTLVGRAKFEPQNGAIMWRIKKFQGEFECFLQCEVLLSSSLKDKPWVKPPIGLEFQIPMFTASGLRIRFLKVYEKSGYKPTKLHKSLTKAGDYEHRN